MATTLARCAAAVAVAVALLAVTACGTAAPTAPGAQPTPTAPASVQPHVFPLPSGPARLFAFAHESDSRVSDYTRQSRFVLYDNGVAAPRNATGTLAANQLTVRYNGIMQLSDFENAIYALAP